MSNDSSNYAKTWELSLYELNRLPHEVINDNTEIAVSPRSLHNELMCPICLDILKNTMTTKECLHRFCHDCIITALRAGNKECPTCRKKLISKRSLRRDPNFDALISKIYPNREEYDALHEKVLEKLNKKHLTTISSSRNNRQNNQNSNNANNNSINNNDSNNIESNENPTASNGTAGGGGSGSNNVRRNSRKSIHLNSNNNNNNSEESQQSIDCDNNATTSAIANLSINSNTAVTSNRLNNNNNNQEGSRKRTISDESDIESRTSTERSHLQNDNEDVELILKPHPKETNYSSRRFLKTTSNATETNKYDQNIQQTTTTTSSSSSSSSSSTTTNTNANLSKINSKDSTNMDFNLFIINEATTSTTNASASTTNGLNNNNTNINDLNLQSLSSSMTLEQIIDKFWKLNKPLELYYISKS